MSKALNHQRLNNQKRTIKRGADSRRAISDEVLESLTLMRTYPTEVLREALGACITSMRLLATDTSSATDQRSRDYLSQVAQGIQKILNGR